MRVLRHCRVPCIHLVPDYVKGTARKTRPRNKRKPQRPFAPADAQRFPAVRARTFSPRKPNHRRGRRDDSQVFRNTVTYPTNQSSVCFTPSNTGTGRNIRARSAAPTVVPAPLSLPPAAPWIIRSNATVAAKSDVPSRPLASLAHLVLMSEY